MPPEHESAFAAWYSSPETKREMTVISSCFYNEPGSPTLTLYQTVMLALQMEILASLNVYADERSPVDDLIDPPKPPEKPWEDSDGDETWKNE